MRNFIAPFSLISVIALGCGAEGSHDDDEGASTGGASGWMSGGAAGAMPTGGTSAGGAGASGTSGSTAGGGSAGTGALAGMGGMMLGGTGGATGGGGSAGAAGSASGGAGFGGGGASGGGNGGSAGLAGGGGKAGGGGSGGKAGGGGNGGASGAPSFEPCPATGVCRILPLGDSITDGFETPGGYRIELFSLALENQKQITFVGGSVNGPTTVDGQQFPRSHEGHSGWTISQIDGIVPSPALNVDAHIILLHIGTNDMGNATGAPERLASLIDQIIADSPNALLVVSNIIPFPLRSSAVMTFNAAVPGIVEQRRAAGRRVLFVDQFAGFPMNELDDGIHPNPAGYARMAGVWYRAISAYLH